jgi:hypothetical protein
MPCHICGIGDHHASRRARKRKAPLAAMTLDSYVEGIRAAIICQRGRAGGAISSTTRDPPAFSRSSNPKNIVMRVAFGECKPSSIMRSNLMARTASASPANELGSVWSTKNVAIRSSVRGYSDPRQHRISGRVAGIHEMRAVMPPASRLIPCWKRHGNY